MSDTPETTAATAAEPVTPATTPAAPSTDPVAAARAVMAGQAPAVDEIGSIKRQLKALWIVAVTSLVLVLVVAAFTLLPRAFGFGRPGFVPGQNRPGMMQGVPGRGLQGNPGQQGAQDGPDSSGDRQ